MDVEIMQLDKHVFNEVVTMDVKNWKRVLEMEYYEENDGKRDETPLPIHGPETPIKDILFQRQCARFASRCKIFPDGEMVAYCKEQDRPFGVISSLRIDVGSRGIDAVPKKWHDLTDNGYFTTHKADGNLLACVSISVLKPDHIVKEQLGEYKRLGVSEKLVLAQLALANRLDVDYMIAFSRPMDYAEYVLSKGHVPIEDYLEKKRENGKTYDRSIGMHKRFGANVAKIIENGRPLDCEALGYNIIMDYTHKLEKNRNHDETTNKVRPEKTTYNVLKNLVRSAFGFRTSNDRQTQSF